MSPAETEKESQKTGEFFEVCGTSQRNLLPWFFVVEHSTAWGQSFRKLWNQTVYYVFFGSNWNLKAYLRWCAKGSCRGISWNEFLQVLRRRTFVALPPPLWCRMHTALVLSVSVVRLSRNSNTIRGFIGLLHWVPVATDQIVWLSLMVHRSRKTQRWLAIWDYLTHMESANLCNDQPEGRWAGRPSLAMSGGANHMKITFV